MKQIFPLFTFAFLLFSFASKAQVFNPDQNKHYNIISLANNEVLTNPGHGSAEKDKDGSEAKLITTKPKSVNATMQEWRFIKVGQAENLYMIVNRHFNNYIDVPYGRKNQNETVFGYRNKGGQNQQFYIIPAGSNLYFISPKISGFALTKDTNKENHCLYRPEDHSAIGAGVYKCLIEVNAGYVKQKCLTGEKNQMWKIELAK